MTTASPRLAAAESKAVPGRDTAIDFTKGILVLFMVLYHWLNYFIASGGHFYNYLRFLTPSFIFITGFMISQIHIRKYGTTSLRLPGRLLTRGVKLLAVFIGLNLLIDLISGFSAWRTLDENSLPGTLFAIFVTGNVTFYDGQKTASFGILLVIAYLLIISAGLTLLCRRLSYAFHYALAAFLLAIILLMVNGTESVYLDLLMTGTLGVVLGYAKKEQIAVVTRQPYLFCSVYVVYLLAISIWDVTLPVQVAGVILTTTLIYIAGQSKRGLWLVGDWAVLLGKYSLFGYIVQIAILQVLRRISWLSQHGIVVLLSSLLAGFVLTVLAVELMDRARVRSGMVNRLYQLAFA